MDTPISKGADGCLSKQDEKSTESPPDVKEGNILFNDAFETFIFKVILRQTYGKGPLR